MEVPRFGTTEVVPFRQRQVLRKELYICAGRQRRGDWQVDEIRPVGKLNDYAKPNRANASWMDSRKGLCGSVAQSALHSYERSHDSGRVQALRSPGQQIFPIAEDVAILRLTLGGGSWGRSVP